MPFEDSVSALLRFDSGAIGSVEVNWLSPRRVRDLAVLGEKGLLLADYTDFRAPTLQLHWGDGVENIPIEPREPLVEELTAFVSALRDHTPMPITNTDALAALAIADAITESARTGRPVTPAKV
jgi:predicted dehydrogenase